jgi:D-glycero-beta-D-manno-heptose-7-phosphate kinase
MQLAELFEAFNGKRVLVIGDVMTDAYIKGQVTRMSPEAPVPVVDLQEQEQRIGGAGNVALNLIALGAKAILASVIGQDNAGKELEQMLQNAGIQTSALVVSSQRKTTIKTRVLSNGKQMLRIDSEDQHDLQPNEEALLKENISALLAEGIDGVLLEDYNKGVLTTALIQWIISEANARNIPIAVDPKKKNFFAYVGCTLFKPNLKELKEGLHIDFNFQQDPVALHTAITQLQHQINSRYTLVTLSEHGVQLFDGQKHQHHPAHRRNIADVSGAGDTVIATTTLCLICGASPEQMTALANLAGGLVCEHPGVVSIDKEKFLQEALQLIR